MEDPKQEMRQNDAQCHQSQELKHIGLITSDIVHSFNNSIGVIRGYADLALRATSSDDRRHAYLKHILDESDVAKDLSEKMRIFSRQKKPDFKIINIHPVVEQAIKLFRESSTNPIDIQQNIDTTCGAVLADTDQIRQAVINLCDNARCALGNHEGVIEISLKEADVDASLAQAHRGLNEGEYLKLTVRDTGSGMTPEALSQIFEPFFTTKNAKEHAGLGLTIVEAIVKNHNGKIIVESKLGEGTTLDIYLPLADIGIINKEG